MLFPHADLDPWHLLPVHESKGTILTAGCRCAFILPLVVWISRGTWCPWFAWERPDLQPLRTQRVVISRTHARSRPCPGESVRLRDAGGSLGVHGTEIGRASC